MINDKQLSTSHVPCDSPEAARTGHQIDPVGPGRIRRVADGGREGPKGEAGHEAQRERVKDMVGRKKRT